MIVMFDVLTVSGDDNCICKQQEANSCDVMLEIIMNHQISFALLWKLRGNVKNDVLMLTI